METVDDNLPSQPIITDTEVLLQEILIVEVSEEVTDTQATVIAHRRYRGSPR